jgi:nucleotide-binding universal stress UspA family protein
MNLSKQTRIVVAVDTTEMSRVVVEHALDLAMRHAPAELHFMRVISPSGMHRQRPGAVDAAHDALAEEVRAAIEDFGGTSARVRIHACAGEPAEEIESLAEDVGAELIVVGRHGGIAGDSGRLGSVPEELLGDAHASVLVVQPDVYEASTAGPVCPDCVAVREESHGNQWFCDAHSTDRPWRSTQLIIDSFTPLGGNTLP